MTPRRVIFDCQNRLTSATPLIEKAFTGSPINVKYLILFRNPIKTIHAIYEIEHKGSYSTRPRSFSNGDSSVIGAARAWKNTYAMIHDQMMSIGESSFKFVELEQFTASREYVRDVFEFLEVNLDADATVEFARQVQSMPLRSSKYDSVRNSDLYKDPDYVLSNEEISRILEVIRDVSELYEIDGDLSAQDYLAFHRTEKAEIGFR